MSVMGMPGGEDRKKRMEAISEAIMTENFHSLMLNTKPQGPGNSKKSQLDEC